jgi:hypothetical protein
MSSIKTTLRLAVLTAGAILTAAPRGAAFQRPPPGDFDAVGEVAHECLGYGKGEFALPVVGEDGRMSAYLIDCDGEHRFELNALLTGCMPGDVSGEGYWFGGLYGEIWQLGEQPTQHLADGPAYGLEGTWRIYEGNEGIFVAQALRFTPGGRMVVAGKVYGKFVVLAEEPLGLTATWSDAALPGKETKGRFRDAAGQEPAPVRYRDAASVPSKGGKSRFGDAASGVPAPVFYRDAASVPSKGGKSRYRDVASGAVEHMVGCLYLRFRFYE